MADENNPPEENEEEQKPLSETLESLKQNEKVESLLSYAKSNNQETVAYVLMLIGIVWMFFNNFYGGILVGLVAAFFFSKELSYCIQNVETFYNKQGLARCVIFGGCLFALFIAAPGIFLGAGLMIGLKLLLKQI